MKQNLLYSRFAGFWLALIFLLCSTLMHSTMHALVRVVSSDLHPLVVVFFRNLIGLIVILPLLIRAGPSILKTSHALLYTIRAVTGVVAMSLWFWSLSRVPLANATSLSFSTALFAAIAAWLFLGERMRFRRWAAIVIGFAGVLIVLRPAPESFNVWSLVILISAMAWGISITIVKKLTVTEHPVAIVAWMGISLTILSAPAAIAVWQTPTWQQLQLLLIIGALASGGHLLFTHALRMTDVTFAMSMDFFRLIWSVLLGLWLFAEALDGWTIIGAMIIFAAGWFIVMRESRLQAQ